MPFKFSAVKVEDRKVSRKANSKKRGQGFYFKFRPLVSSAGKEALIAKGEVFVPVVSHNFTLCEDYMKSLEIQNHSIALLVNPDEDGNTESVAFAITPENHKSAKTFLKKEGKEKNAGFIHNFLVGHLVQAGILEMPALNENGTPVNEEDPLLGKNQYLDLEIVGHVEDIVELLEEKDEDGERLPNPAYMREVDEGEGFPVYEVVKGEAITANSDDEDENLVEGEDVGEDLAEGDYAEEDE